ncbi:conserved hypothetical protein [Leishmania braziliensis MHOM/BR/75/M2904]|uniref:Uncharacterized protein n=2 Tax=Leishmania braziliensis TaxID=5660 RepID=A4HD07_LEIBR|nr:conserved hypothetical protein [Leishmania braziliensis MHOM/BR/75/M2904]KAI5688568.1 hypothetical protein MNV84_04046 [Leishmania braziliensis]CAJ2473336.1 unnamed protein product [Leishmania braziliensis]CAJ2473868.1 unnamed protein product [Leishmania braziliensis]CAM36653.1 conserved hypothetical protein [Leishmania braziliensis MHOM/BR/75/M2904]
MLQPRTHGGWRVARRYTCLNAVINCIFFVEPSTLSFSAMRLPSRASASLLVVGLRGSNTCSHNTLHTATLRESVRRCQTKAADTASTTTSSIAPLDSASFLSALLEPERTVSLEDTTRTYATMDVVERCDVYDPSLPNVASPSPSTVGHGVAQWELDGESAESTTTAPAYPLRAAHAQGRLWSHFVGAQKTAVEGGLSESAAEPPAWFVQLCRDLYFRTDSTVADKRVADNFDVVTQASDLLADQAAAEAAGSSGSRSGVTPPLAGVFSTATSAQRADDSLEVDPYTWLPFDLLDVKDYGVGPYEFPPTATYTLEQRVNLCLGQPDKEYVHFCSTYCFPQRWQIPTSMGTQPARLLVDPSCPTPVVFLQLSPDFPPVMWLPMKPSVAAIRGVLSSFATQAFLHREEQHAVFAQRYETAKRVMELQQLPTTQEGDVLRFMAYEARNLPYLDAPLREYPNQQEFFLGEYDDPERLLEHFDLCPFVFAISHLRTVTDLHAEHMTPTIEGAGVAPSLFRCIFSKALIQISVHLSAEVKLPPQDPEAFHFMWKDSQVVPKMKIPVFARVLWPDNRNLCGGGLLARRFNKLFGTEFASDTPVDAILSVYYVMQWAQRVPDLLGVAGMRQRVAELEAAAHLPEPAKLYPGTREIPNPEYTASERLGMHIQYLSHLGDPQVLETIQALLPTASAPVRMGCAKAALIAGDRELFRHIVSSEPPGRTQHYMTKLVVKRKTRDLVDPEPRLLEDQYEFAAPLWTKRGTRIDRNTLEGAVDAARLLR